jgi:hypothetical protein
VLAWPATVPVHTASPAQGQGSVPPQPSVRATPHFPPYAVAHVFGAQQVPSALHTPLFGQAFVIVPPQPSSKVPHATIAASGGRAGVHGFPHLPFALHTSPVGHLPQSIVPPPQALFTVPHSRPSASHSRGASGGPHRFAMPAVAHDSPGAQPPQSTSPVHPSETKPHSAFWD